MCTCPTSKPNDLSSNKCLCPQGQYALGNMCSKVIHGDCFPKYKPVCGCDGVTYGNSCVASFLGVKKKTKGICNSLNQEFVVCLSDGDCPFGSCQDGRTYQKYSCLESICEELNFFADPCLVTSSDSLGDITLNKNFAGLWKARVSSSSVECIICTQVVPQCLANQTLVPQSCTECAHCVNAVTSSSSSSSSSGSSSSLSSSSSSGYCCTCNNSMLNCTGTPTCSVGGGNTVVCSGNDAFCCPSTNLNCNNAISFNQLSCVSSSRSLSPSNNSSSSLSSSSSSSESVIKTNLLHINEGLSGSRIITFKLCVRDGKLEGTVHQGDVFINGVIKSQNILSENEVIIDIVDKNNNSTNLRLNLISKREMQVTFSDEHTTNARKLNLFKSCLLKNQNSRK
ncbi:MAG: hypothetical protein HYY52_03945 [Candidatus Melainabacteria bacterium]|nr:hypothetical protein [Candidatus Melainabacteria bacterium]